MGTMYELCAMAEYKPGRIDRIRTVDFSVIPAHQAEMHARLLNWARAQFSSGGAEVAPGFGLYRPTEAKRIERMDGLPQAAPVDRDDAKRLGAAIVDALGLRHRRALGWYYVQNCHQARQQAEELCLSLHGLAEHVIGARQALMDRGA